MPCSAARLTTLLFLGLCSVSQTVWALDVYIVAGQSNGYRISSLTAGPDTEPRSQQIYYYGMRCVSEPESSEYRILPSITENGMGYGLASSLQKLSNDDIILIQYCRCGAGVWDKGDAGWYPGDDPAGGQTHDTGLYGRFLKYVAHAKESAEKVHGLTWNLRGIFWHQGESDSGRNPQEYRKNLSNLFWRMRHDLGEHLPIVAGHIRNLDDGDKIINATLDQMAADDPRLAVVPVNDLQFAPDRNGTPDVHLAREGCFELGRRMVIAHAELRKEKPTRK